MFDLVLQNATVINAEGEVFQANIAIQNGIICDITSSEISANQVLDCSDNYITPTFVNAHAHTSMSFLKGVAEDVSIESWFNDYVWPYEKHLNADDIYHGAKIGFSEMIDNGITVVADHYLGAEHVIRAAKDLKLHLDMSPTIFSWGEPVEEKIAHTLALHEKYKEDPMIELSFGPHSAYTVTTQDLATIANAALQHDMKIHIHACETQQQVETHYQNHGQSPIETLRDTRILEAETILAHSLSIDEKDAELIRNSLVVYCPKTYLRLSMPFEKMYDHKTTFAFGTDGAVSNATLNILEQASLFSMLGKAVLKNPETYDVHSIWQVLMKSHERFNFNTGDIQIGKSADLILWNLKDANTAISYNILATILFCADKSNIEQVLCRGNFVKGQSVRESISYAQNRAQELKHAKLEKSDLVF